MKKLVLLTVLLASTAFVNAEVSDPDKKWLTAVQKMVASGQKEVATKSQERADLVKEWAKKEGYSVDVKKTDAGYRLELNKLLVKK